MRDVQACLRASGHTYNIQSALQLERFTKIMQISKNIFAFVLEEKAAAAVQRGTLTVLYFVWAMHTSMGFNIVNEEMRQGLRFQAM